jgi:hypothetical protein
MSKTFVYDVRELSWQSWEISENGRRLAVMCSKAAAERWLSDWIKNGRRDDFYNMVGE